MLLTIERVLILKTVPIFAQVPDSELSRVATILKEIEVSAGDQIIRQGDEGSELYIVVDGEVTVRKNDQDIASLSKGEVVGELSALDPEPRMADVFAKTDSLLFRLEGSDLYHLMADHMDVTRGIISVLCKRIRS